MVTVHEQIKELQTKANGAAKKSDVDALISNDGTTKKLFGYIVTISDQGAITLTAPSSGT